MPSGETDTPCCQSSLFPIQYNLALENYKKYQRANNVPNRIGPVPRKTWEENIPILRCYRRFDRLFRQKNKKIKKIKKVRAW